MARSAATENDTARPEGWVYRTSKPKTLIWFALFGLFAVVLGVDHLAMRALQGPTWWLVVGAFLCLIAGAFAVLLAIELTRGVVLDDDGISLEAPTRRGRKHWAWDGLAGAELRRYVIGPVLELCPKDNGSGRRRDRKPVTVGGFMAAATVWHLADAVGAHVPVTRRPAGRWHWRPPAPIAPALFALALVWVTVSYPLQARMVAMPGTALHVAQRISVSGPGRHRRPSNILSLSVASGPQTLRRALQERGKPAVEVVSPASVYGHQTKAEYDADSAAQHRLADTAATYVALHRLGYRVRVDGGQPVVDYSPAGSPMQLGDRVDAVDGTPTPYIEDLYAALDHRVPGDQAMVTVTDLAGHVLRRRVTLAAEGYVPNLASLAGATFASVPLALGPLPISLTLYSDGEGGPSGGLAMTLGLLDALAPAPIVGPVRVAVTGTIAPDGAVGPIGGLRQKVASAQAAGATMLILPTDEVAVAQRYAGPRLRIVGVHNVDEAVAVLAATTR